MCHVMLARADCGPVAQLGARLHGMEEVEGSNPSRSTTIALYLIEEITHQTTECCRRTVRLTLFAG